MATHPLPKLIKFIRSALRRPRQASGGTIDVPSRNARIDKDLRKLVWQSMPYGPELLIENMWRGMPVHPMLDELVGMCVTELKKQASQSDLTPHSTVTLKFPTSEPADLQVRVTRHVIARLKNVQSDPFYLDLLLRAKEWELASMITLLYDLHFSLLGNTGKIIIED
jgi:hypothetical protein